MRIATVVLLAVAGCSGTTKFSGSTVALSITPDSTVTAPIEQLTISVSGADTSSFAMPPSAAFAAGQPQRFDYAVTGAGTLDFTIGAMAHGMMVATGTGSVSVQKGGSAALAIALAAVQPDDMAQEIPDLSMPADMAMPPGDMTGIVMYDLLGLDLAHGPIVPSNTTVMYDPAAADLSGVVAINTSTLQIAVAAGAGNDGGTLGAPPTGVGFVVSGAFAVMTVGKWTVDKEVKVSGTRGLIVIAKSVDISNVIHVEAVGPTAGPGGAGATAGTGHGFNGGTGTIFSLTTEGGGGGASHATAGGAGGTAINAGAGGPGATYGMTLTDLSGGSGGGLGGNGACGPAGAGGGALQISADASITVELGGVVNAGGGGAPASCAGAGSGGTILFEARAITVLGVLSANGGNSPGDAIVGRGRTGGSYGFGATVDFGAAAGTPGFTVGGGGGGGGGRIALRTSGPYAADVHAASAVSPAPVLDTTVP